MPHLHLLWLSIIYLQYQCLWSHATFTSTVAVYNLFPFIRHSYFWSTIILENESRHLKWEGASTCFGSLTADHTLALVKGQDKEFRGSKMFTYTGKYIWSPALLILAFDHTMYMCKQFLQALVVKQPFHDMWIFHTVLLFGIKCFKPWKWQ